MKERPIIFSGPMVRAILEGRKTQTRRVVKLRDRTATYSDFDDDGWPMSMDECGDWHRDLCPYGVPGDRLWVRETWAVLQRGDCTPSGCPYDPYYVYRADNEYPELPRNLVESLRWRSSIHMPRWASRITLEIESVRVERLCDISQADAKEEGYQSVDDFLGAPWATSVGPNPWVWVLSFKKV